MKIVIIANSSKGLWGFRRELIEELVRSHEVFCLVPNNGDMDKINQLGCKSIEVPLDRRGTNPLKDYKTYKQYVRILRSIAPKLIITYTIKPNIYGGYAARKLRIPYAANITGLGSALQGDNLTKYLIINMYKIAFRNVKVVFFENIENLNDIVSYGIVDRKRTCLLNGAGVNTDRFDLLEYPDNSITRFLFIGRIMKEKGVDELFNAMKRIICEGGEAILDVLGDFDEADYKNKIKEYESQGWLKYYGYQSDVRQYIKKADCFVLPSWHEGMANTNLECASSGRPIITTNIHGCKEAVEDGVSGFLVRKKDSEDLYLAMKKIMTMSRKDKIKMGLAGRERMKKNFEKSKVIENTLDALMGDMK